MEGYNLNMKVGSRMNRITVYHYDAFSTKPNYGNPAGVVLHADSLSDADMQPIAGVVGFNETVFVLRSSVADLRLRYFTPGHEINLCGHATIASIHCLKEKGVLQNKTSLTIETRAGVLPVSLKTADPTLEIEMRQDRPQFISYHGDVDQLAGSLGLTGSEIDISLPIVYGSTGTWTLLVPIRRLSSFMKMAPKNRIFPDILKENPRASVHPFCMETHDPGAFMHARHFSSPYSGTLEDPVTGTASGVMGAYYLTYMNQVVRKVEFLVEQGMEIGRNGRVFVQATRGEQDQDLEISIRGTAVFVKEMKIEYE
ncbi:putative isomerase YddE [compost metagenome]